MFAMAWSDDRQPDVLNLARDRHGEVPLHLHRQAPAVAASELKAFTALGRRCGPAVVDVPPGRWQQITADGWVRDEEYASVSIMPSPARDLEEASALLRTALRTAAARRAISDVPVCTLLSGGIDSAAIALELRAHYPDLVCYTAVLDQRSRDLRCAREVADHLGVKLVEVPVEPPTGEDLAATVRAVELPFKAQVEIAWPCLKLAEVMRRDGFRVTYSGEGSDELWASYGFAYHALKTRGWHEYRRDLIADQARKNFPRVNKAFLAHGVEARLPFLDPHLVALALSLPRDQVADSTGPKAVLTRAYAGELPASVLTRPKLAFQDGMGLKRAIAATLADPGRFYRAEYARAYG
jgi:asparagine synthase (glutamine-hydrolysing)